MEPFATRYVVDRRDVLVDVDDAWLEFARENAAPDLTREAVIGRRLWDYVLGAETVHLYRLLFERVRTQDVPVIVPFRCDSPELRRFMRLVISPAAGGELQLDAVLVRSEPAPKLALLDPNAARDRRTVVMCSTCKRILVPGGDWVEPEDAVVRMRLVQEPAPRLEYAVCGGCRGLLSGRMDGGAA